MKSNGILERSRRSEPNASVRAAAAAGVEALESRTLLSTTSLLPSADAFVRNHAFRPANLGQSPILGVKTALSGDSRTSFLKFDIGGVSSNIDSAILRLNAGLQNGSNEASITGVFPVLDTSWVEGNGQFAYRNRTDATLDLSRRITGHGDGYDRDSNPEGELTWNNQPAADLLPVDTVTVDTELLRTYSLDLTPYIRTARLAGRDTISLALKNPVATDSFTRVLSREFTGGEPRLLITEAGETAAPVAQLTVPDVITSGGAVNTVTVTYLGNGIDPTSLGANDISVLDPNGAPVAVSAPTVDVRDGSVVATYDIQAPGGAWDVADNGVYRVQVNAGAVTGAGGDSASALAEFRSRVDDNQAPTVVITPTNPTLGSTTYSFTAVYTDNVAIDASTINLNNFQIDAPDGTGLGFTLVDLSTTNNAHTITATYTTEAPGGPDNIAWATRFDGNWTITLRDNQVYDTAGNPVARTSQGFTVNLGSADNTGPSADIHVADINSPGGTVHTVRVDYSDNSGIDLNTLGTNDITVTGPGGTALGVTGFTINSNADPNHKSVTYTIAAPGGAWDAADNGVYTVTLNDNEVKDSKGNAAGSVSDTFTVAATGLDTVGPTATISISDLLTAGASPQTITVTYTDDVAVDVATLGLDDITVTGPAGPVSVTDLDISPGAAGAPVTVAYQVAAPTGGWSSANNGTYNVTLNSSSVRDTSNNTASAASGSFEVNISGGNPADPTFNAEAPQFTVQGVATQSDGKLLLAGYIGNPSSGSSRAVLERRTPNGSIDQTFGTNGQIISPTGAADANYALIIQNNDHVITAGTSGGNFVLTRYDLAGKIDTTFGAQGRATADFGAEDAAFGLSAASNGALVAVGTSGGNFAIARFADNGATDFSFGDQGIVLYSVGQTSDGLGAVVVQDDGKIIAAGARSAAVAVIRLNSDGTADKSFSGDGLLLVGGLTVSASDGSIPDHSQAIAIQQDGRILISNRTPDGNFGLARVTAGGNVDSSFGEDGLATAAFGGEADVDALLIQTTGQILAVGTVQNGSTVKTGVAAFDSSGHLISNFGEGGTITVDANILPSGRELHIGDLVVRAFGTRQPDGRIVVGSSNQNASSGTGSSLNRLIVPGSAVNAQPQESVIGQFGLVNGKKQKLTFPAPTGGATITLTLAGASGTAFTDSGNVRLSITDLGPGAKLTIKAKGGSGRLPLGDVTVTGSLKAITGKTADLSGTLFATGAIGKVALGNISGTIASEGGFIGNVAAASLNGATILSGANLGSDALRGGLTTAADTFIAGTIGAVKVTGGITNSVVGAGVDPNGDDNFLDDDNHVVGGSASTIKSITSKGAVDAASRFYAGVFGNAKIPAKVDPATDPHFKSA